MTVKRRSPLEFRSAKYAELIEGALLGEKKTADASMKRLRAAIATASRVNKEEALMLKRVYRRIRV